MSESASSGFSDTLSLGTDTYFMRVLHGEFKRRLEGSDA